MQKTYFDINKTFVDSKPGLSDFQVDPETGKQLSYVEYKDDKDRGFILRVTNKGAKSYLVRARIKGGDNIAFTIGKHGSGHAKTFTADGARKRANEIMGQMKNGIDPRQVLKDAKAKAAEEAAIEQSVLKNKELTLRAALADYRKNNHDAKDSTKKNYESVLANHAGDWLDLPMSEISPEMVLERYSEKLKTCKASAMAPFKIMSSLFNSALKEQEELPASERVLTRNPVRVLSRKVKKWRKITPRTDRIQPENLPAWFAVVTSLPSNTYRTFFVMALVTGCRKSELLNLRWSTDIDFDNKTFTARDTKNHTDHTLPITPFVERLLRNLPRTSDYVLPGQNGGRATSVNNWADEVAERSGVEFTPHALRRTFANMAEDAGIGYGQLQAILNHKPTDVTGKSYLLKDPKRMREPLEKAERYILSAAKPRVKLQLPELVSV